MNLIAMAYTKDTKLQKICIFTELVKYSKRGTVSPPGARVSNRTKTLSLEIIVYYRAKGRISRAPFIKKNEGFPMARIHVYPVCYFFEPS